MASTTSGLIDVKFAINAWGAAAGGVWPRFVLRLDGQEIGQASVNSATPGRYEFTAKVAADQAHRLQLHYDNDALINGMDRNLFVRSFEINGMDIPVTHGSVRYDRGALDGRDVTAGQEGLYWGGALNVDLPASHFPTPAVPAETAPVDDTYALTVTAWRNGSHWVPPLFKLLVDDKLVAQVDVKATSPTDYKFTIKGDPNEPHKIQIIYPNDAPGRDLFVKGIKVDGQFVASTSQYASYDKGPVDSQYVVPGQEGLFWGGALTFGLPESYFNGPAPVVQKPSDDNTPTKMIDLAVKASGTSYNGIPAHFKLMVDGHLVGEANATAATQTYSFKAAVDPTKAHHIQVVYDNDAYSSTQDRNLYVDSLTVNGRTIASTATGVVYDKGALDGKDVVAGTRALLSNGALDFSVPASTFTSTVASKPPAAAAFYVATNGKDSWSGKLAAPNADGTDGPFASLEKAQAAMRASSIDTTYVRGGTYHLTKTLELTAQDNGHSFKAYNGEKATLSGGQVVKGFTSEGNGVYSAKLATATDLDLSIGGVRQRLAEKGNWSHDDVTAGWYFADAAAEGPRGSSLRYHGTEIARSDIAPGTRIQIMDFERLEDAIVEVASINTATRTLTFKSSAGFEIHNGATFRLLDNPGHVNKAGEFAWRESDGKLVFKPEHPTSFQQEGVEVARLGTLVRLTEAKGVTLEGLTFTNTLATGEALVLSKASGNHISNNDFLNVGTGIALKNGSSNNLVFGNDMEHLARHGVNMTGGSNGNRISGNDISHIGEIYKHVAGVMGAGVSNNVISHNDISDSARYGISLKNWSDTTLNYNNVIEYNRVTDTVRETADAGAIETLGRSSVNTGTIIRGNYIEGAHGLATSTSGQWVHDQKGFGIYLDDMSGGTTVAQNFIKETGWNSVFIHGGDNNVVKGNFAVLASNQEDFIRVGSASPTHGAKAVPYNNTITGNLVYGELPLDDYVELWSANNPVINKNFVANAPAYGSGDVLGNPLFTNRLAGDYSLQAGSKALAMGISDLEWEFMGNHVAGQGELAPDHLF
ncbi:carbohydrate-binding domain-containing protein [Azospirillum thermophilum]|uniref:Right handed beta helix domain-containing protein n=1 Tax=Azospirillum thermophilum TaxID=2202148 RepID=A0A2S2D0E0_9PROT|nr:carbohydrate-binding domain-containing protein [Azospirillum thermophilum]AWK90229.1 hypothetical protein DEW08_29900 [Azospirillum thermophilum]